MGKVKVRKPNCVCAYCGKKFWRRSSCPSKSGLYFCCREHKDKSQTFNGSLKLPHYGTGYASYRDRALRGYPQVCDRCGYKEVPEILMVHHIDRDRKNNELSNLQVLCPNCHEAEHFKTGSGRWSNYK